MHHRSELSYGDTQEDPASSKPHSGRARAVVVADQFCDDPLDWFLSGCAKPPCVVRMVRLGHSSFQSDHGTASRFVPLEGPGHLLNVEASELLIDELTRMAIWE